MIMMIYASLWIIFTHKEHAHNTYAYKYCSCVCGCVCAALGLLLCVYTLHTYIHEISSKYV